MNKSLVLVSAIILCPMLANAGDAGKNYFSLSSEYIADATSDVKITGLGVAADAEVDAKDGYGVAGAFGHYLNDNVRIEGEFSYHTIEADTLTSAGVTYDASGLESKAIAITANAYYTVPLTEKLSPYIGGGLGWAQETEDNLNALAYQARIGVDYKLNDKNTIYGGYHYFGTTDFESTETISGLGTIRSEADIGAHALEIGYRYTF